MDKINQFKFQAAIFGAKITSKLLKTFSKSSGTSLPGIMALKVDENFLSDATKYCDKKTITITGTNGKTTTSGLIAAMLSSYNQKVLHNYQGANMPQGIATALATGINPFKKSDYFVLETDEAYLTKIYSKMKADYLVVTNLFNDQTDRHGAINLISNKIREAIDKNSNLKVILNADDVMLRNLYTSNTFTYGFEKIEFDDDVVVAQTQENVIYCICGEMLTFSKTFYDHIGHYACPCGYKRSQPDVSAVAKIYSNKISLKVLYKSKQFEFTTNLCGVYNAYNVLAAIAIALELGVDEKSIQSALDCFVSSFGRANKIKINDKNLYIQMVKNPAGMLEGVKLACTDSKSNLLIMINDEYSDGRDVSWLWDVDFSVLKNYEGDIYVAGKRACDVALRLKYSDVDTSKIKITENIESAYMSAISSLDKNKTLYALPCYSAMVELKEVLKKNKVI